MKKYPVLLVIALMLSFQLFSSSGLYAQTSTTNSPAQLKSFIGKYQFKDNKMVFLQILLKDDHLVLKQLWDNQEIPFKQTSELEFYNDEHSFPLKFTKNSTGEVNQVLAFDRDEWNRVADNYTPELQKTIQLSPEQLKSFEGKYQMKNGDGDADDFLQIIATNDHLVLKQLWDQREVNFAPVSDVDFFNDVQTFPLKFTKGADGFATQLLANNKDIWIKVK